MQAESCKATTNIKNMNKKLSFVAIVLLSMLLIGCQEDVVIDHPVAGHRYANFGKDTIDAISAYARFYANGTFLMTYQKKQYEGYKYTYFDHLIWSVSVNDITIIYDYTSFWPAEDRGKTVFSGFYNPQDSTVTLNGQIYQFLE